MHIIWAIAGLIAWFMLFCYMTGLALFLLGFGMYLETKELIWLIPAVFGALIMCRSN
jgi:hypothetical protein